MSEPRIGASGTAGAGNEPPAVQPRPILTTRSHLALRVFSGGDVAGVHAAALDLLGAEGATAEAAAQSAPSSFVLAGRVREHDVTLGDGLVWLAAGAATAGPAGVAACVRPVAGGEPAPATGDDLRASVRLADALPEVAIVAGPPVKVRALGRLAELALCFAETSKHLMASPMPTTEAEAAVAMAAAVGGSAAEVRRRPPLSLCGGPGDLEAALVFARAGLPVGLVLSPGGSAGLASDTGVSLAAPDAPAPRPSDASDVAGALVRHHAGVLAGCAAVQAAAPGAPFFYVADPAAAGLPAAGPTASIFQLAATQLAAHVGLPLVAGGHRTSSHEPDWQACMQDAFISLSSAGAGADVTGGAGTLGAGAAFGLQQLVMDSEIFSWNAKIVAGIEIEDETIALDAIKQVGIGGNFLGQRHTRRHMKDVWRPRLLDRTMWDAWIASGREGAYEKASALAGRLIAEHAPVPLGGDVVGTLQRIAARSGL